MITEIHTFTSFSLDSMIEREMSEQHAILQRNLAALELSLTVTTPIRYNKKRICVATGMSYTELNHFLAKHGFNADGKSIEYEAMEALEKWYLKKLKRFLRNGISTQDGAKEEGAFVEFCRKYKKVDSKTVNSWKDIDEERVLCDFRNECEGTSPSEPYFDGKQTLFAAIYATYLFHTRCRITRHTTLSESIIKFMISHRYHIFITEGDSYADENNYFTTNCLIRCGESGLMGLPPRQNS